jgi:hypothetical protein
VFRRRNMKVFLRFFVLFLLLSCAGCSYWPQTLEPQYYDTSIKEVKEDIDDVSGARTL